MNAFSIDDTTNTLTSSLASLQITELGTQHWKIDFAAAGFTSFQGGGTQMTYLPGGDDAGVNWLHWVGGTVFELNGDWTGAIPGAFSHCGGVAAPLAQGRTCLIGTTANDVYFAEVLDPTTPAVALPEPASLALAGLALTGAALARRRRA